MSERPRIPLPPPKWRPRPPTIREKKAILERQGHLCAVSGHPLRQGKGLIRFDHRPPIHEREWDEKAQDTIPSGTDVAFIRAVDVDVDRPITGSDVTRMNKVGRLRDSDDAHRAAMERKARGEPKPPGKLRSRGFSRQRRRPSA